MPHIRMRALSSEQAAQLSSVLVKELAQTVNTSEDNFTFELISTQFFLKGASTASFPFIEVLWFDRPQQVQDACSQLITRRVKEIAAPEDVVVVFTTLSKEAYYENGEHF